MAQQQQTAAAGSSTTTVQSARQQPAASSLVFGDEMRFHKVDFKPDVVDNEHLGRKKSKSA